MVWFSIEWKIIVIPLGNPIGKVILYRIYIDYLSYRLVWDCWQWGICILCASASSIRVAQSHIIANIRIVRKVFM